MGIFSGFRRDRELESQSKGVLTEDLDKTMLVENEDGLKKEREKIAFEKILQSF